MPITLVLIFAINVTYVAVNTLRVILVIKQYRFVASALSTAEVLIYLVGLNIVLDDIYNLPHLTAYCIGWGTGVYVGSRVEKYLALGYISFQIIVDRSSSGLPEELRRKGFAVTSWLGDGRDGPRLVMYVLAKRNRGEELMESVAGIEPRAFCVSYEPAAIRNGFWLKR